MTAPDEFAPPSPASPESNGATAREQPGVAQGVAVSLNARRGVSLALQQMGAPVLHAITLRNGAAGPLRELEVCVTLSHDLAPALIIRVDAIEAGGTHVIERPGLELRAAPLSVLEEPFDADLVAQARAGGVVVGRAEARVRVLPLDQWPGGEAPPESLAAFSLPNHATTQDLLNRLRDRLRESSGDPSLAGYQSAPARVREVVRAAYDTLQTLDLSYVNPPAGMGESGQRVRLPHQIIESRMGTCLDLAMLAASLLEAAGLHPVVVVEREHAYAGAWLADESFAEPVIDAPLRLRKRVELGELVVFEATGLTCPPGLTFHEAAARASERLRDDAPFAFAVDVRAARRAGVRALALRAAREGGEEPAAWGSGSHGAEPAPAASRLESEAPAVPAPGPALSTPREPPPPGAERLDRWKRKLLDLSLRNRLINQRATRQSLAIDCDDLGALEDALADGREFRLHAAEASRAASPEQRRDFLRDELSRGRLRVALTSDDATSRLTDLYRAARAALDDSGACTLYLALGSLLWTETPGASERRRAPLLLLPVSLERPSAREPFILRRFTDEPRVNVTLLEKLRLDFKLDVSGLEALPEDERGVHVGELLGRFRRLVRDIDGWEVRETCDLGLFSFSKFLMWLDLHARAHDLMRSPMVSGLVRGTGLEASQEPPPVAGSLDEAFSPSDLPCLLDADSSQLGAVAAGIAGRSFVLQGPPGTGKSQTIANLIGCALARGKRVLFVAEKRAALDVVRTRLDRSGLGPFCLEVHSHVAGKRDVLDQLQEAIEAGRSAEPPSWSEAADDLCSARQELNAIASAMHETRPAGLSWYEATCRVLARPQSPAFALGVPEVVSMDHARVDALRRGAVDLARAARAVWPIRTHPLREISGTGRNAAARAPAMIDACRAATETLACDLDAMIEDLLGRGGDVPQPERGPAEPSLSARDLTRPERGALLGLAALGEAPPGFEASAAEPGRWPGVHASLAQWCAEADSLRAARAELERRWLPTVLEADLDALERALARADARSFVGFRWWLSRTARKTLRPHARGHEHAPLSDLLRDVRAARAVRAERARLAAMTEPARVFGPAWKRGEPATGDLEACIAWGDRACAVATSLQASARLAPFSVKALQTTPVASAARRDRLASSAAGFDRSMTDLAGALAHDAGAIGSDSGGALASLLGVLARWRAGLDELDDWAHWRSAVGAAGDSLAGLAGALTSGVASPDTVPDIFEKSLWHAWAEAVAQGDPRLASFSPGAVSGLVERFRAADARIIELARGLVRARLSSRLPESAAPASEQSEMGLLQRQLKLQRRHMPVRRLIERLPNLLPRLKPCFLMSPLSVAQYLDAAHPPFDLVIFDEASQIPVWDAVGAIARGRQVIVVGDSRQLPPTTFFRRLEGDDTPEEDIEELESVLDEAVAAGTPEVRLLWHYRSRHESLISFSNQRYYGGRLQTFPSAKAASPSLGVHLRRVPGVYDRSGTRTNRVEAEALVAEVVGLLKESAHAKRPVSLGVVTFSQAQQTLIEDLFDRARREHSEIEPYFTQDEDPVFVKNLENVQGDERDAMYFSIGYGPDAAGHLTLGFGPLNRVGGERRLNVAVTRARSRLIVFTSMNADAIDLSRTASLGAAHLRAFLEHAERAASGVVRAPEDLPAELLAPARGLQEALRARGYESDVAVGASPYRVDLGVRHPQRPAEYALGVEFDGPFYARALTCRDRERSRQSVLANLGWSIERVYTHEWARQPHRVVDRIIERLSRPGGSSASGSAASVPSNRAAPVESRPQGAREATPYKAVETSKARGTPDQFHDPGADRAIGKAILEIVAAEGPITPTLLARRVASFWRLSRVTSRVHARIAEVLASQRGMPPEREGALWPGSLDPSAFEAFRPHGATDDDWREIDEIPAAELRAVVAAVLRTNVALPLDELARQAALWMGFARATARTDEAFTGAARQLAERGGCVMEDGQVRLV